MSDASDLPALDWRHFENVIEQIQRALDPGSSVERVRIADRSTSRPRQVDVIVRGRVGGYRITVLIECRNHRRPTEISYIEGLVTKRNDTKANKAIVISASGFEVGAREKADFHGIDLFTLRAATEQDWPTWVALQVSMEERRFDVDEQNVRADGMPVGGEFDLAEVVRLGLMRPDGKILQTAPLYVDADGNRWSVIGLLNLALGTDEFSLYDDVPLTGDRVEKCFSLLPVIGVSLRLTSGALIPVRGVELRGFARRRLRQAPFRVMRLSTDLGEVTAEHAEVSYLRADDRGLQLLEVTVAFVRDAEGVIRSFQSERVVPVDEAPAWD